LALSGWLVLAAALSATSSIAVYVESNWCFPLLPRDPFSASDGANQWVLEYLRREPHGLSAVLLFASAFPAAAWALAGALRLALNWGATRGHCDGMQVARRTVLAFAPVACIMAASGIAALLEVWADSVLPLNARDLALNGFALLCGTAMSFGWLGLTGHVEGGPGRAGSYLVCGALALLAWLGCMMLLGGLLTGLNVGQLVHLLRLR
jgi:hypothetical protein